MGIRPYKALVPYTIVMGIRPYRALVPYNGPLLRTSEVQYVELLKQVPLPQVQKVRQPSQHL